MTQYQLDAFKTSLLDKARMLLTALISPDPKKKTKMSFFKDIIPSGWNEIVYEYEDKFIVDLSINKKANRTEEIYIMSQIRNEMGDNITSLMAENTPDFSSIKIQLKK